MTKKLYLIGLGPGDAQYLVPSAKHVLDQVTEVVGYQYYLDLIADIVHDKNCHASQLGGEVSRARVALDLSAEGKCTALVSSGDIGIYAMASVVFELLDLENSPQWQDIEVEVIPGVSAMQAAAARIGAPMGHDFCTISLSDLLTPWEVIEKRITAAAEGDFVISFYNPVSKKRNWQLDKAIQILLKHRAKNTPVIVGRNLTRDNESLMVTRLTELDSSDVDMLSLVMVGNSSTKAIMQNDRVRVYTPRGYASKYKSTKQQAENKLVETER